MKNNALFHSADVVSFQNFFKTWLLDCGTDQEHLRLSLPGAFNQDNESKFKKCEASKVHSCCQSVVKLFHHQGSVVISLLPYSDHEL